MSPDAVEDRMMTENFVDNGQPPWGKASALARRSECTACSRSQCSKGTGNCPCCPCCGKICCDGSWCAFNGACKSGKCVDSVCLKSDASACSSDSECASGIYALVFTAAKPALVLAVSSATRKEIARSVKRRCTSSSLGNATRTNVMVKPAGPSTTASLGSALAEIAATSTDRAQTVQNAMVCPAIALAATRRDPT